MGKYIIDNARLIELKEDSVIEFGKDTQSVSLYGSIEEVAKELYKKYCLKGRTYISQVSDDSELMLKILYSNEWLERNINEYIDEVDFESDMETLWLDEFGYSNYNDYYFINTVEGDYELHFDESIRAN